MRDNYNRLYELYDFINMLHAANYGGVTREQIKAKFDWEPRTMERMLNVVETMFGDAFIRDYTQTAPRRAFYYLQSPDLSKMPKNTITTAELSAIKAASEVLHTNKSLSRHLDSVANKLTQNAENKSQSDATDIISSSGAAMMPRPMIKHNPEIMATIQNAILAFKQIQIQYHGKTHTLCPLGLLYGLRNTYLIAAHERHIDTPRRYICGDIESVTVLDKSFNSNHFDIHEFAKKSFGVYSTDNGGYDIEWRVAPDAVADANKYIFHPTQKTKKNRDGSMTVRFHADGLREMAWHLFTWGGKIVPVAPTELVDEYKQMLHQSLESLE